MWTNANEMNAKETGASKADEAKEANANLVDDGKLNFCCTTTSYSLESFSLLFSQSPSQNIVKSLLK